MTLIYDMYRANIDYSKCEQLACMHVKQILFCFIKFLKVRAYNLSNICARSMFFFFYNFNKELKNKK